MSLKQDIQAVIAEYRYLPGGGQIAHAIEVHIIPLVEKYMLTPMAKPGEEPTPLELDK